MKKINTYIIEKFKISKDINFNFSPDEMGGRDILLYSDEPDDEGESQADNDYMNKILKKIDSEYTGFISFRDGITTKGPVNNKNLEVRFISINNDLFDIWYKLVDGKDYGYEVKLSHGRLKIDAINSGSRATFYIYALSEKGYNKLMSWVDGETDDELIFTDENNFEQIDDKIAII